ncbi:Psoralen synthase (Fragment) [Seminavis robusta]|uniref:Psoralen synthase n=1 Tax=Seminavis robusta TaxID=568900 RepID=A0A9N8EYL8_9STRA
MKEWAEKYGDSGCFEIDMFGKRMVVVCREDRAAEVYAQRPFKVTRTANLRAAVDSVGGTGVFSAEGEQWKQERKLISTTLNRSNMKDYLTILKGTATSLIQKWEVDAKESSASVVTVNQDLTHALADSVAKVFIGHDMGCLRNETSDVASMAFRAFKAMEARMFTPIRYWNIPFIGQDIDGYGKYFRKGMAAVSKIIDAFELDRASAPTTHDGTPQSKLFLGKLYDAMEKESSKLSRERVTGNIMTAFAAGTETTSSTLATTLFLLASNVELQSELRDHVKGFDLDEASFHDYYTKLPLLKSFLHEVHRFYTSLIQGLQTAADIPFCGTTLPKGSRVLIIAWHVTLQKESPPKGVPAGLDNAPTTVFSPRRYLVPVDDDDSAGGQKWKCVDPITKGAAFLPFGHGVRSCPGRSYSEILSYSVLIKMLQTFKFELAPDHAPVKLIHGTVTAPDKDIQLKLTPINVLKEGQ